MSPCKDEKCQMPHRCATCEKFGHISVDQNCTKFQLLRDWFTKRMTKVDEYYDSKKHRNTECKRRQNGQRTFYGNGYNKYGLKDRYPLPGAPNSNHRDHRD